MEHFYQNIFGYSDEQSQGVFIDTIIPLLPKNNLKIAEIGVLNGRLTAMWNVKLINKSIDFNYYAIDNRVNLRETLETNIKPVIDNVTIINKSSELASLDFPDEFFDLVYIDADHTYDSVISDIKYWLPKVKHNGCLAGDDYNYKAFPGLVKAVDDLFEIEKKPINLLLGYNKMVNTIGPNPQWWIFKPYKK